MVPRKTAKLIRSLRQKKYRHQHQLFVVEGAKSVQELLISSFPVKTLIVTKVFVRQHQELIRSQSFDSQPIVTDEATLSSLSSFKNNNAALALVALPSTVPTDPAMHEYTLALDDIRDPGNLGTITRVADWYGISQIVCSRKTTDAYAPKAVSASMGSLLRVKVAYTDLATYLAKVPGPVYGAVPDRGENIHQLPVDQPGGIILLGNESTGIRADLVALISKLVYIPRYGRAESLNVGIAAAVICDNLVRKRGR